MISDRLKKMLSGSAADPSNDAGSGLVNEAVGFGKKLVSSRCDATLARADELISQDRPAEALKVLIAADGTLANGRPILRRIVQLALALGDFEACGNALDRLIKLTPDDPTLHMQRRVVANQMGEAFLFWRSLRTADRLYRAQAEAGAIDGLCGLLDTSTRMGDRERADDVLRVVMAEAHRNSAGAVIRAATNALVATGDVAGLAYLADGIDTDALDDAGRVEYADLLVKLERNGEAERIIGLLTPTSKKHAELLAWAAVRNGDVAKARELVDEFRFPHTLDHLRVYSEETPLDLTAVGEAPGQLEGPIIITMTHNESSRMADFFAHYRGLGFKHFLAIDNGSSDGTLDMLGQQPDVFVYSTSGDFRRYASGRRWVNQLVAAHGANTWSFVVDADELLVFPDDHLGVDTLVQNLDASDAQVMFGLAIDMHAERLDEWKTDAHSHATLTERFPFFDGRTRLIGSRHAPYLSVGGGLRNHQLARIMPENLLTKPIAVKGGEGVRFMNPHLTNPARAATITAAVLHYKFAVDPNERVGVNSAKGVNTRFLAQDIAATRDITLRSEHSIMYENSAQLYELGLLRRT